ncbi:MAG: hypothetical protein M3O34_14455 [Chloroflexota bacterium]|nr:hypothetical protein [Chloroflexota bacterium]
MNRLLLTVIALVIFGAGLLVGTSGRTVMDSARGLVTAAPTTGAIFSATPPTPTTMPTVAARATVSQPTPAPTAAPRDLVIEVAEAELNQGLEMMLVGQSLGTTPLGDATISSITVSLRDGQMYLGGGATIGAVTAPFTVVGQIAPDPTGRPLVTLTTARVATFVMPPPVVAGLGNILQGQIDQMFAQQAMRVRSVEITDGRIRIVATQ